MSCKCGFKVTGEPGYDEAIHIIHCPLHKAALEMLQALKHVLSDLNNQIVPGKALIEAVIKKANGAL